MNRAARQHGVFTWEQALAEGVGPARVRTLVTKGVTSRHRRGIYVVCGSPDTHEQGLMAAVLAAPPGAAGSHLTAAYMHGRCLAPPLVHITVGREERLRLEGVTGHRSVLPPSHRAMIGAVPVTSLARTVVDLASMGDVELLTDFVDPLLTAKRLTPGRILRTLDEIVDAPGRHGTQMLRRVLAAWTEPIRPGSPAEARLLRRLTELGMDGFVTQYEVVVGESRRFIDVAWPEDLVGLEYAGKDAHNPRHWESDEARFAVLAALGWRLREVDAPDLVPGERAVWNWLRSRLPRAA